MSIVVFINSVAVPHQSGWLRKYTTIDMQGITMIKIEGAYCIASECKVK